MLNTFKSHKKAIIFSVAALAICCSSAYALPSTALSSSNNAYIGIFGGGGSSANNGTITQQGTAFFPASSGGALFVDATGNANNHSNWIVGLHAGYNFRGWLLGNTASSWTLVPGAELEGYYLNTTQSSELINPTIRIPEHTFSDNFPIDMGVFLVNSVWTVRIPCATWVSPYAGGGVGAALISVHGADSTQLNPPEAGINHFNSSTNSSDWSFAAQAKAGLRFNIDKHWQLFAEYRYLYVSPSNFTFGSTQYPTHVPTSNWNVNFEKMQYNMGVAGIEYNFDCIS